ncbi:hypothetical protein ES702_06791 [subsurface metagenome]
MEFWQALIDNSGAVIAVFTIVLAITTIIYVVVSWKLLKQSKNAILADIILKVVGAFRKEVKEIKKGEEISATAFITAGMKSYLEVFMKIDKRLGTDFEKLFEVGFDVFFKEMKTQETRLKEKAEKERNKGSGTS